MPDESVLLSVKESVATITLNRPERLNALDQAAGEALARAIRACRQDEGARSVILTGAGRGFCAGGGVRALWEGVQKGRGPRGFFRDFTVPLHRPVLDMRSMGKPVVGAVHGTGGRGGRGCGVRPAIAPGPLRPGRGGPYFGGARLIGVIFPASTRKEASMCCDGAPGRTTSTSAW